MITKTYTYKKPSELLDVTSAEETVTCTYTGPQKLLVVISHDERVSIEHLPLEDDDWEDIEEGPIDDDPETTDRYMVLNASNDDHIVIMQVLAGETVEENINPITETIATYTFSDDSTFELKHEEDNPIDPQQIIDADSIRINPENVISYNFREQDNNTDEELIHALTRAAQRSWDHGDNANTVAETKLWKRHSEICNWIKDDLLTTVPRHKLTIPNIVDIELGGSFRERDVS